MDEQQKHIDELFREQLGDYTEMPPASVWDALEQRLDNDTRRKRKFIWWPIIAVLLLGSSLAGYLLWSPKENGKPTELNRSVPASPTLPQQDTARFPAGDDSLSSKAKGYRDENGHWHAFEDGAVSRSNGEHGGDAGAAHNSGGFNSANTSTAGANGTGNGLQSNGAGSTVAHAGTRNDGRQWDNEHTKTAVGNRYGAGGKNAGHAPKRNRRNNSGDSAGGTSKGDNNGITKEAGNGGNGTAGGSFANGRNADVKNGNGNKQKNKSASKRLHADDAVTYEPSAADNADKENKKALAQVADAENKKPYTQRNKPGTKKRLYEQNPDNSKPAVAANNPDNTKKNIPEATANGAKPQLIEENAPNDKNNFAASNRPNTKQNLPDAQKKENKKIEEPAARPNGIKVNEFLNEQAEEAMAAATDASANEKEKDDDIKPATPEPEKEEEITVNLNKGSDAPKPTGGGGGGGGAPTEEKAAKARAFEAGIKAGFERGVQSYTANKYIFSVYGQYDITKRIALLFQPTLKLAGTTSYPANNYKSYYDIQNAGSGSTYLGFDSSNGIKKYYYRLGQTYDSTLVGQTAPRNYVEIELPIMVKYALTPGLSCLIGMNVNISGLLKVTDQQQSYRVVRSIDSIAIPTPQAPSPEQYFTHTGDPYTSYTTQAQNATTNPLRFGYILGLSYIYKQRLLFDVLMQQSLSAQYNIPDANVRKVYAQPYFRVTVGYKLFGKKKE